MDYYSSNSPSNTYSDYKAAEYLAQSDHGMQYIGGIGGFWTHPTNDSKGAAELMHAAAVLRMEQAIRTGKGLSDIGHLNSWYSAQEAAHGITRFANDSSNTRTQYNSLNNNDNFGSSYNNNQRIVGYYSTFQMPVPGTTWSSNGVTHTQTIYGSAQKTAKCWRCGSTYDYGMSSIHCA